MTTFSIQQIAWAGVVSEEFVQAVLKVCSVLGWPPSKASDLMACMAFETGETFSSTVKNMAGSGAVGLIQFMPATAKGLGTTVENLALMSEIEQLYFVSLYFKPYARRVKTLSDMYMAILMPKYIGALDSDVLFAQPSIAYRQNSGLDEDSDGIITKAEASAKVKSKLLKGLSRKYVKSVNVPMA